MNFQYLLSLNFSFFLPYYLLLTTPTNTITNISQSKLRLNDNKNMLYDFANINREKKKFFFRKQLTFKAIYEPYLNEHKQRAHKIVNEL
jgi:hypothetical protein